MAYSKNRRLAEIVSDTSGNLSVEGIVVPTQSTSDNDTSAASTAFVHAHIDAVLDSAPGTLNTLNEIAAALNDDANFNTTISNAIAAKLPLAGGTLTGALTMNVPPTINNARVLVQRSNDDSSITFANNASGAPSSHTWAIGLDYSASNGLAIAYSASGIPSLTGNNLIQINTSGNVEIGTSNPSGNKGITIQAGTDSSASLRLKNDAQDWDVNCQTNDTFAIYNQTNSTQPFSILPNGNVGIGITPTEGKLHVKSDGAGEVELLTLENSTGTNGKTTLTFKTTSTDATKSAQIFAERVNASGHTDLAFRTYNGSTTEHMRIDADGNVGIGTNDPAYKLDISGTSNDGTPLIRGTASNTPSGGFNWATEFIAPNLANDKRLTHIWGKTRTTYGMAHVSYMPKSTASESYLALGLWGADDKLNVLGNGNVGIGTTSPNSKLSIVGGATSPGLSIKSGGNAGVDPFRVTWTNGTEGSMFIVDDSGNVGIGESSPDTRLHIKKNQSSANSSIKLENAAGGNNSSFSIDWQLAVSGTSAQIKADRTNSPGAGDTDLIFSTMGSERMVIYSEGYLQINTFSSNADDTDTSTHRKIEFEANGDGTQTYKRDCFVQHTVGHDQYHWYKITLGSNTYGRGSNVKYTINWSTEHASGQGFVDGSFICRARHDNARITVHGHRVYSREFVGGSYYGWSSNPDVTIYESTSNNADAGVYMRVEGHRASGYAGGAIHAIFLEIFGSRQDTHYQGIEHVGTSTPSDLGSAISRTILS